VYLAAPALAQTAPDAEAFVKSAVTFAKAKGTYNLIKEVNSPTTQFKKGELYIFILDMEGVVLAHGADPKLVGNDLSERRDANDVRYIQDFIKVAGEKGSGWVDYKFNNPVSGKVEDKTTFVELYQIVIIGCGVYKR
jgi:signal transduction histidine kinase